MVWNKPVLMLSAVHTKEPEDTCQHWSKKDKCDITVRRPNIVQEYNAKMGGADLSDRMMSYYRMSVQTKKWTIRMLMHFIDLALVNSWLLYRRDHQEHGTPRKAIMTFMLFMLSWVHAVHNLVKDPWSLQSPTSHHTQPLLVICRKLSISRTQCVADNKAALGKPVCAVWHAMCSSACKVGATAMKPFTEASRSVWMTVCLSLLWHVHNDVQKLCTFPCKAFHRG